MQDCNYIRLNECTIICKNCNRSLSWSNTKFPLRTCTKSVPFVYKPINFIGALLKYIKSGGKKVTKEQYEERLKICEECRYRDSETNKCTVCGCKISGIFNKSMLPKERCPIGRWPPTDIIPS